MFMNTLVHVKGSNHGIYAISWNIILFIKKTYNTMLSDIFFYLRQRYVEYRKYDNIYIIRYKIKMNLKTDIVHES